jgi:hypothetical protein
MIAQYNELDSDDRLLRDTVSQGIRKLNMGGVPWSPKLQPFRDTIELWKMIRRKRKGLKISVKRIRCFMFKTSIRDALTNNLEQVELHLKQAGIDYAQAAKSALAWRNDFLYELAKAKAEKNKTKVEKEWKALIQIKKQRRQARNIKRMRGKLGSGQVTKVYQTDEDGTKTVCETQATMVKAFFKENDSRFSQTKDTPPMQSPLVDELGYLADTDFAEQVLNGTYKPSPAVNKYAIELLHELRTPKVVRKCGPISLVVTPAEHTLGWKRTKEKQRPRDLPWQKLKLPPKTLS